MSGLVRGIGGTSILLLGIVGLAGCGRDNRGTRERSAEESAQQRQTETQQRDREAVGHMIQNINKEPQNYYGKTVTVSGEVKKLLNPRAFEVSGEGMTHNDMLVVTKKPLSDMTAQAGQLAENARVEVSGIVRPFDTREIGKEVGFTLDDQMFKDWRNKPVVIAESITITPAGQGAAGREEQPMGREQQPARQGSRQY